MGRCLSSARIWLAACNCGWAGAAIALINPRTMQACMSRCEQSSHTHVILLQERRIHIGGHIKQRIAKAQDAPLAAHCLSRKEGCA
eukprot:359446-Pelagomonas_calceolata.AAC.1